MLSLTATPPLSGPEVIVEIVTGFEPMVVVNWFGGEGGAVGGGRWFWDGGEAFVVAGELRVEVPATEEPPPGEP